MLYFEETVKQKTGNFEAAIFLERIRYWSNQVGREFYKFNAVCEHPEYKPGDSWQEELFMTRNEFDRARKTVATRIKSGMSKSELMQIRNEDGTLAPVNRIVLFWQDRFNKLWYWFNQELYNAHFLAEKITEETGPAKKQPDSKPLYRMTSSGHPIGDVTIGQLYGMSESVHYIEMCSSGHPMNQEIQQSLPSMNTDDDEIQKNPLLDNSNFLKGQGVQGRILDELKTRPLPELVEAFELARKKSSNNPVGYAITMLQQGIFEKSVPQSSKNKNQFDGIDFSDLINNDVPADKPPQKKKYPWENSDSIAKNSDSSPSDKSLNQIIAENHTAQKIWDITSNQLEHQLGRANFDTWLRPARLRKVKKDGTFVVKVHNESARNMLQHRLYKNVHRALSMVTGNSDIKIQFITEQIPTLASIPAWQNQVTNNLEVKQHAIV